MTRRDQARHINTLSFKQRHFWGIQGSYATDVGRVVNNIGAKVRQVDNDLQVIKQAVAGHFEWHREKGTPKIQL